MKTILSAALLGISAIVTVAPASAQRAPAAVLVVVDTDRIYRDCTACKTAQASLQSQITALRSRQETLTNQLKTEGQPLQAQVNALGDKEPDAALKSKIQAFQTKEQNAQQELAKGQQNIQSIQANVMRQINERLNPAINQVMTARGANFAVDMGATLAHGTGTDVTAEVLAALNTALPSVSLTPLPQAAATQSR